jgi:hypothetical protein
MRPNRNEPEQQDSREEGDYHDCREKVRPGTGREAGLGHAGGTSPWMGEGRTMQEQLSRAMPGAIAEEAAVVGGL